MAFGKEIHGISQRFSHSIQHPISLCVGDKIPLPCSWRRSETSSSGGYPSICQQHDFLIEQGHVSKDHVHSLVSAPTHLSASQIMPKIKGRSSRMLQQEFPHLKKRYWGRHIWAWGYFCATCGSSHWSKDPWLHWRPCGEIPGRLLYSGWGLTHDFSGLQPLWWTLVSYSTFSR